MDLWNSLKKIDTSTVYRNYVKKGTNPTVFQRGNTKTHRLAQGNRPKLVLLTQYFDPINQNVGGGSRSSTNDNFVAKLISNDMDRALLLNLNNPAIDEIVLFTDMKYDFTSIFGINAAKIKSHLIMGRASFNEMFDYANNNYENGTLLLLGLYA